MVHAPAPFDLNIPVRVNLYSDTQTKPSRAMKEAMMEAEVGDEQHGSDPTVNALCERMAALLGKEAAVFMPSGTMCNEVAILTHCRPGEEIMAHETAHIVHSEGGAPWALAGVSVLGMKGANGMFGVETLEEMVRPHSRYAPPQRMVEVEQTANLGGGAVWALDDLNAVAGWAHAQGMVTHMDGARLMNAVVAAGVPASDMAAGYDTVWLDFTKGLGAPLGAVLAGSSEFIGQAWRWKQRIGGSMRQGGICAAACLYALDHNIERLAEDHANAKALARGLAQVPGLALDVPETNLVYADTKEAGMTAAEVARAARMQGLLVSVMGTHRVRLCTHLDVDAAGIEEAISVLRGIVAEGTCRGGTRRGGSRIVTCPRDQVARKRCHNRVEKTMRCVLAILTAGANGGPGLRATALAVDWHHINAAGDFRDRLDRGPVPLQPWPGRPACVFPSGSRRPTPRMTGI